MHASVLVVGGGPAASAAALACLLRGIRPIVLAGQELGLRADRVESLVPMVRVLLRHLGVDSVWQHCASSTHSGFIRDGKPVRYSVGRGGHVRRIPFAQALLKRVQDAGGHVVRVTARSVLSIDGRVLGVRASDGVEYTAEYTIDASGTKRVVARCAMGGSGRKLSPPLTAFHGEGLRSDTVGREDIPEYHSLPEGWVWTTQPIGGRVHWTALWPSAHLPADPTAGHVRPLEPWRAVSATWSFPTSVVGKGFLLAGDAAGRLDPGQGQGVLTALWSGGLAGATASLCASAPRVADAHLQAYEARCESRFVDLRTTLRQAYEVDGTVYGPWPTDP